MSRIARGVVLACALGTVWGFQGNVGAFKAGKPQLSIRGSSLLNMATALPVDEAAKSKASEKKRLHVAIGDKWYDLTGWRKAHPGGGHWIDMYHERDATDIMSAFHSDEAMQMFQKFPTVKDKAPPQPNANTLAFREFRARLVREGWWERNPLKEAQVLLTWLGVFAAGAFTLNLNWLAGLTLLSVCQVTGGFLAHDYVHGRGKWCTLMRNFGCIGTGLSPKWWSNKHNKHHAATNVIGVDEDIMIDPAMWLWAPSPENDGWWRKYQHFYFLLPYATTLFIWRFDSIRVCLKEKLWGEGLTIAAHYAIFLALFGPGWLFAQVAIGGAMLATIVTCTHQSEEYYEEYEDSFVDNQFSTSRDAVCSNPISEYVWGGMQYQLEHHLFPTMPRYKYPALVPVVQQWAAEQGIEYRTAGEFEIVKRNIDTYKRVGATSAVEGAPASRQPEKYPGPMQN
mmetsp:Transcript_46372/g.72558  ORF Transcript_46372/g.72558 Transcript_46372/m.72558 type:complete len:453 (-) Transcript_46372:393-1751(-)